MKCPIETRENADLLLDYCARTLDPATTAMLDRHIGECPLCRDFARGQQAIWKAMDEWEAMPVSADFDRRLYRRIDGEVSWWQTAMRPFRPVLARQGLPFAAAACLVVMAGALMDPPAEIPVTPEPQALVETVPADQVEHALEDMELLRNFHTALRADASQSKM